MSGFGDKLRREREMRGVTLEEISESTKIGTRSLRALEQEDFEKLPGGIFNKGFVRAYSRFLGLDEDQTVADFDLALNEHLAAQEPPPEPQAEAKPQPARSTSKLLIAALVLTIAIAAGWYAFQSHHKNGAATGGPNAADNSQRVSAVQPKPSLSSSASPANPQSSGTQPKETASETPLDNQKALSNSNSSAISGASRKAKEQRPIGADTGAVDSSAPIRLQVFAREDSWLSIFADGKNIGQGVLNAQKSRAIRAQKEVRLRVGNVGGVDVSFNGQAVDVDGQPKQVKELIFTPRGLQR